ncbi:MAG: enoyl-CoA hydratase [Flavobacteriaceae bacterium]|nr:MAG: enoyl-CoA hydratase [Flavobacteriaceae bacterium]
MNELVKYESFKEGYCIITLQNGKANAISPEVLDGLNAAFDAAEKANEVVILTGTEGMFSGGYDLKIMQKDLDSAKALVTKGSTFALRMSSFKLPIITACSGHAIAKGGFMLLSSDYRIGVEGDFKIGLNEVLIGMTMHHAGIQIARNRLSPVYLERSVNNAELYNPSSAVTAGFLDLVVPPAALMPTAIKVATMFTQLNLVAHGRTKLKLRAENNKALEDAIQRDLNEGIH